ncbi:MAG TPA: ribonuclease HI [Clostridiales bacterium]|nr:ribonuclease HI [Clostridiales bacterium]
MKKVTIYTDGACSGNPGPGGWAAILKYNNHEKEICGSEANTTNNRMELLAAIKALECLKDRCYVDLYSDSAYLINGFKNNWIDNWQRNNWKTSAKKPVENKDLWMRLISMNNFHNINWIKVKGHSDNDYNNRCDKIAREQIKKLNAV